MNSKKRKSSRSRNVNQNRYFKQSAGTGLKRMSKYDVNGELLVKPKDEEVVVERPDNDTPTKSPDS